MFILKPISFASKNGYGGMRIFMHRIIRFFLYVLFSFLLQQVVPNTRSRSQMGETTDGGLYEIFQQDYGPVGSATFETARENFLISSAGYAVASLLLQPKDRHNGNLLFDEYVSYSSKTILDKYNARNFLKNNTSILPCVMLMQLGKTCPHRLWFHFRNFTWWKHAV